MKKNLRIVSVAAAALLAVAPVAATAMPVNAATTVNINGNTSTPVAQNTDVNLATNFKAIAYVAGQNGAQGTNGVVSGSVTATYNGQSYTGNLTDGNAKDTAIYSASDKSASKPVDVSSPAFAAGQYYAVIKDVSFNFGSQNAGKKLTVSLKGGLLTTTDKDAKAAESVTVTLDKDGVANFAEVQTPNFKAVDPFSTSTVAWYNNNAVATSANVTVNAGSNNLVNVSQIVAALNGYTAHQLTRGENGKVESDPVTSPITADAVTDQLKAQNIAVDGAGYFTAPTSLSLKFTATANNSNASAELPVTVSIPNGKVTTVESVSKTVMHNAYYYDKDAKRVGTDKLTRYNSVTVSPKTTTIKGKAYYEVVENGKLSGKFINADNIDGTKRTLKHNAYVYASSKKRANKVVLKKGTEVTTYGGSYTFKNGKQYYKIGNNTDKTYVKASNF
ncbi:SLAP domain-containing protein [Lactobacillus amylovorus]|uniref:SLAP domain-containing protein n=1 Tax=Lactobacillus amylovorus TaxID=1604 RepID=UPI00232FE282|nr:SLAP domain-containing protein [Lactobacillus amylovorus]MDB6245732.1 SLAP domain-containing protein [Lactobacillus amylovorus]MDB6249628.1 SLAP domain-containing protein [Lactobacillus amylovorus]MDB6257022.1 SLAP domain-containing protein [Lactobacillus amylovorus]MDB6260782.1 SLAP domain-containing protein [Lactobacillus amylovorus]